MGRLLRWTLMLGGAAVAWMALRSRAELSVETVEDRAARPAKAGTGGADDDAPEPERPPTIQEEEDVAPSRLEDPPQAEGTREEG